VVQTTLETSGAPSANPFLSQSLKTSGTLSLVDTATLSSLGPTATANITGLLANNIFQPIATDAPPPQIQSRSDHPVPRLGIQQQEDRLETNKFYANFFLGDQSSATWTHPYSLSWSKGSGQTDSWGIAISHIERDELVSGPKQSEDAGQWSFFAAPTGIQSIVISAVELSAGTTLTTDTLDAFSVNVNLVASGGTMPTITFPLLQGMGFVTAKYNSGTPLIQSGVGIQNVTYAGGVINGGSTFKYKILLTDGFTWLVYVTPLNTGYDENSFTLIGPGMVQGPSGFGGYMQVAKIPANVSDAESVYDGSAGVYATACSISGAVDGTQGTYELSWTKQGAMGQSLLMFALPHHMDSITYNTRAGATDIQLVTTTKGMATAIEGDNWTLTEPDLPITMGFNPWSPTLGDISTLSATAMEAINAAGAVELLQNISNQTNTGSTYYDGKALAKFAAIVYVLHELADNATLALTGLMELEDAFDLHVNNQQTFPLVYDTAWGGVVSVETYLDDNSGDDFGNTYYNE
jgi:endo-1,3(4)-beta-glucanase